MRDPFEICYHEHPTPSLLFLIDSLHPLFLFLLFFSLLEKKKKTEIEVGACVSVSTHGREDVALLLFPHLT